MVRVKWFRYLFLVSLVPSIYGVLMLQFAVLIALWLRLLDLVFSLLHLGWSVEVFLSRFSSNGLQMIWILLHCLGKISHWSLMKVYNMEYITLGRELIFECNSSIIQYATSSFSGSVVSISWLTLVDFYNRENTASMS